MTRVTLPTCLRIDFGALALDGPRLAGLCIGGLVADDGQWRRAVGYLTGYRRPADRLICTAVLHPGASWALEAMVHRGVRLAATPRWARHAVALVTIYHPGITPGPGPAGLVTIDKDAKR